MHRILKNNVRAHIKNHFRGREVLFKSKTSQTFNMEDEEERARYFFWKERYGFITDITKGVDSK